jgi:hypothetical protein
MISCVPLSLVFGIVGLFADRRKVLSITTTCISGGLLGLWLFGVIVSIVCM